MKIAQRRQKIQLEAGLTVVEALIGIFVVTVIGIATATFYGDVLTLNSGVSGNLIAQGETQKVLRGIASELRAASPSSLGAYPIGQAATSSIVFYSNIDADALKERLRYFVANGRLQRGVIKPTGNPLSYNPAQEQLSTVVRHVANATNTPIFEYFDSTYEGTLSPLSSPVNIPAVRLVKVTLHIDEDAAVPPLSVIFTTQVSMRNLKDNL